MLFNSIPFIFVFLPAIALSFYLTPYRWRVYLLLGGSLIFYSWWDVRLTPLLIASVIINYLVGTKTVDALTAGHHRIAAQLAIAGVTLNLAVLGFFKYRYFIADAVGFEAAQNVRFVIPLAISFYTFQQISFLVDAWRGDVGRVPFIRYAAFVTFFPHLIAGPIFRHNELIPQFGRDERPKALANLAMGLSIFALGLFKKVWLADALAAYAIPVFDAARAGEALSRFDAWSGLFAYHFQIYFDFSGYSTMAIGLGKMLGINLPLNFRSPYKADSIVDFWRRWHITLSRFLRDYLYIPLGGNRRGKARRYLNLLITMGLGGLWHGAAWGFLVWGLLHGLFLVINHAWHRVMGEKSMPFFPGAAITFLAVALAWVPFRAETLHATRRFYGAMLDPGGACFSCPSINAFGEAVPLLVLSAAVVWLLPTVEQIVGFYVGEDDASRWLRWSPTLGWSLIVGAVLFVSIAGIVAVGKSSEFLYFQF